MRAAIAYGLVTIVAVALDQWIKWLVQATMEMGETIEFLPFLAWHRTVNTGISFSFMDGLPSWTLAALALAVTGFMLWLAARSAAQWATSSTAWRWATSSTTSISTRRSGPSPSSTSPTPAFPSAPCW
jgi:signal peptidase II